jgi:hypothetical protein
VPYSLKEDATPEERRKVKEQLVKDLEGAIKLMIPSIMLEKTASAAVVYTEMPSTTDPSTFWQPGETFIALIPYNRGEQTPSLPEGQRLFLRLIPTTPLASSITNVALLDLADAGRLIPMLSGGSWFYERNKYGVYVYYEAYGRILGFTQLFKTGELWGINANCIDKDRLMEHAGVDFGFFPCVAFEKIFVSTLANYLQFAQDTLKLLLPLKIKAGATNVEGYRMIAPTGMHFSGTGKFDGRVVEQHITWEGTIEDYAMQPHQVLRPFFNHVWDACGLERPDQECLG